MRVVHHDADLPPSEPLTGFGRGMTRQSEAKDCDINVIMARFEKTGVLPVEGRQAFFADVSEIGDYRTALHQVQMANEFFMQLPAGVRSKFSNDPAQFLDFVSNEENRGALVEMGLLEPEPVGEPKSASEPAGEPTGA